MVNYLYTGQYEDKPPEINKECEDTPALVVHARVFTLADKYLITGLLSLSAVEFKQAARRLTDDCTLLKSIAEIYSLKSESSRILRDITIEAVRERIAFSPQDSVTERLLDDITDEVPEFTKELLKSFRHQPNLGRCNQCGPSMLVPVLPLQCRCGICGRGGASLL